MNQFSLKILFMCILSFNLAQLSAIYDQNKIMNEFIGTMHDLLPDDITPIQQYKGNSWGYVNSLSYLLFNDSMFFLKDFLKEMIKKEVQVTKDGVVQQKITNNMYCTYLFKLLMMKLPQQKKDDLLSYAISKTNVTMLYFLISLGAKIDAPWAQGCDNSRAIAW